MKILKFFAYCLLMACLTAAALLLACKARAPSNWRSLRLGDTIQVSRQKVPELHPDAKDGGLNIWYSTGCTTRQLGIEYRWVINVDFDATGKLVGINGRSYNEFCGLLDSRIRL